MFAPIFTSLKLSSYLRLVNLRESCLKTKPKQNVVFLRVLATWESLTNKRCQISVSTSQLQDVIWSETLLYGVPIRNSIPTLSRTQNRNFTRVGAKVSIPCQTLWKLSSIKNHVKGNYGGYFKFAEDFM